MSFNMADKDKDGKISKQEYLDNLIRFEKMANSFQDAMKFQQANKKKNPYSEKKKEKKKKNYDL